MFLSGKIGLIEKWFTPYKEPTFLLLFLVLGICAVFMSFGGFLTPNWLFKTSKYLIAMILALFFCYRILVYGIKTIKAYEVCYFLFLILAIISSVYHALARPEFVPAFLKFADVHIAVATAFIGLSWLVGNDGVAARKSLLVLWIAVFTISIVALLSYFSMARGLAATTDIKGYLANPQVWFGIMYNPNRLSMMLLPGFMLAAWYMIDGINVKVRFITGGVSVLLFMLILFSQCRGALLSAFVFFLGAIIWKFFFAEKISFKKIIISVIVIGVVILTGMLLGGYDSIMQKSVNQGSTYRLDFWIDFFRNNTFGAGISGFVFGKGYIPGEVHQYNNVISKYGMHNFILETWVRLGFPAMIVFCIGLALQMFEHIRHKGFRFAVPVLIFVLAFLLHNSVEDYLFFTIYWIELFVFVVVLGNVRNSMANYHCIRNN